MGYGDVGYHGTRKIMTPHIDSIANEGVHFSKAYSSASVCGPSRSGLLTGVYQQRFGAGENMNSSGYPHDMKFPLAGVPKSQSMVSEMLKAKGYKTGMVGKWHLGMDKSLQPNSRGYDFYYGFLNGSHDYTAWTNKFAKSKSKWPVFRNYEMEPPAENIYLTDLFSNEAVQFIDKNHEKPFFLFMSYNSVHHPWQVPQHYVERVKHLSDIKDTQIFMAMVLAMDNGIGRVLNKLKEKNISENTIVIFTTDNGTPLGQGLKPGKKDTTLTYGDHLMSSAGKFRGFKGDTYEGGTRVPLAIKWPNKIKAGQTYTKSVSTLDLVPTILAPLNQQTPSSGFHFDGVDLLPYIQGIKETAPHETLYWRRDCDYAMLKGKWKITWNDRDHKRTIKLFNLEQDPFEKMDLANSMPEKVQTLQNEFDAWDSQQPDNLWWGGPENRNRGFDKGNRTHVAKFNQNSKAQSLASKKIRQK